MSRKLWMAHLVKSSPRYPDWFGILGADEVPLSNSKPFAVELGGELTEAYSLDLERFDRVQTTRLLQFIVEHFGVSARTALQRLESDGFPIRACDVSVSYDVRLFI